jgi:hypothetical protein
MVLGRMIAVTATCAGFSACQPDLAHHPISINFPSNGGHAVSSPRPIEAGKHVGLSARQQEAVVIGVSRWLKDSASAQFGEMQGARNSRNVITVCGTVDGRNTAGRLVGLSPFVGVLQGTAAAPAFVLVEIGTTAGARAEVMSLCRDSGLFRDRLG